MKNRERPMVNLFTLLESLDGKPFNGYRKLSDRAFRRARCGIHFVHIQRSPGAFPASVCHLRLGMIELGITGACLSGKPRRTATADYLLRAFAAGVSAHARQNRGALGSGSFQPLSLPPQVLERNVVTIDEYEVRIAFHVSLPGSHDNRVLGREAVAMFDRELSGIVRTIKAAVALTSRLKEHCDVVEDMVTLQNRLTRYGLVAFVGDGALLVRESGVSESPLAKGVYPHIPGDGRERVVTLPHAALVCAEEGRAVTGLDISGFIARLPRKIDCRRFSSQNASGSTSQAAAIVETVLAGAKLLLIDEDSSAANFLIKDRNMRRLIPEDTITPLFDRVQELYREFGVSTLIVVGGSSEYLGVAKEVIAMRSYQPVHMTDRLRELSLAEPVTPEAPLALTDLRRVLPENFDPSYHAQRLDKIIPVRIKPLRLQEKVLEYGNEKLDLTKLDALAACRV